MIGLNVIFATIISITLATNRTEHKIKWPTEYHIIGENINYNTNIKERFEIWYKAELKRSRINYNGGLIKKFYYGDAKRLYTVSPATSEAFSSQIKCRKFRWNSAAKDFMPNATALGFTGQKTTTLFDSSVVVDIWTGQQVSHIKPSPMAKQLIKEITLYTFKTDYSVDIPVRYIIKIFDKSTSKLLSHNVTNYYNFKDKVLEKDLIITNKHKCTTRETKSQPRADETPELDLEFEDYAKTHGKEYHEDEWHIRKLIFEKNKKMAHEHNQKKLSFKMQVNDFSDMTPEELKYLTSNMVYSNHTTRKADFPYSRDEIDKVANELPRRFDLREKHGVTRIRHQGFICHACYAFAAIGALEGALSYAYKEPAISLSEQVLIDCGWNYGLRACEGGNIDDAMRFAMEYGLPAESEYGLYNELDNDCRFPEVLILYKIKDFGQVIPNNINAMKIAIFKYGSVAATLYTNVTFAMQYKSGIYYDPTCDQKISFELNHAVALIGYGFLKGEFYWLAKNSWGSKWGQDGFYFISAKNNNCFLLNKAFYPIARHD
ncbi:cathepsin S-like [Anticarsia gemmatalis]|uniref:cathepsin S-like n=1 Tax=Anticarsia gemmatalis TaxID=129554 RepID=UPI003F76FB17